MRPKRGAARCTRARPGGCPCCCAWHRKWLSVWLARLEGDAISHNGMRSAGAAGRGRRSRREVVVDVQRLDARRMRLRRVVADLGIVVGAAVDVAIARAQARQRFAEDVGADLALPL